MQISNTLILHIEALIEAAYNEGYRSAEARIQLRGHDPLGRTTWVGSLAHNGLPNLRAALKEPTNERD